VRIVQMHARQQGAGSPKEELQTDAPAHISQKAIVADSKCILVRVAVRIPRIDGSHDAGIRRDEIRNREDTIAIVAASRCKVEIKAWLNRGKNPLHSHWNGCTELLRLLPLGRGLDLSR